MSIIDITTLGLFLPDRRENSAIAFITWIVLGAVTGFIGSRLINKSSHGRHRDVLLGIVGAIVGGFASNLFRDAGVAILNFYSFLVAIIGAATFLIHLSRAFNSRRSSSKTFMNLIESQNRGG